MGSPSIKASPSPDPAEGRQRLDSWKEIAAYLNRDVRTVQRWEKTEGLPVHRHMHGERGSAYAYAEEISQWWNRRQSLRQPADKDLLSGRNKWFWVAALLTPSILLAGAFYLAWPRLHSQARPPAARITLLVLPFENLTGDPQQEYFGDGLTEELISQLSRLNPDRLSVIARTSSMQYKGAHKTVAQIGREVGASHILESSFRREGNRVLITTQLVRASDQTHLWSRDYERDLREVLSLESEVTQAIAREIEIKLSAGDRGHLATVEPIDPEAFHSYLKGRYFWNQRTEAGYVKAISLFQDAINRAPRYASAYAGLADTYALLGSMPNTEMTRAEAMAKAKAAALTALQIDDSLAAAHTSLAFVKMHYDWDWNGAEAEFRRAIEFDPNYPTAHHWYAYDLLALNRVPEALNEIRRAQQADPLSAIINTDAAELLFYAGRYDEAIQQTKAVLEIDPGFVLAHSLLGRIYDKQHSYQEALAERRKALELSSGDLWMLALLADTYADSGDFSRARRILRQLEAPRARRVGTDGLIAAIAAALGKTDEAFAALQRACDQRDGGLILLNYEPTLDPLRSDPRFQQLLRRIGLPSSASRL